MKKPVVVRDKPIEPSRATEPHWACPDCGQACYCTDELARRSPHVPCGKEQP